jgi:hypothetical protein
MARPSLTPAQMAFLSSLRAGARLASDCQDAITVGELMRLNLVYWNETRNPRDGRNVVSTFSLTPLGAELVREGGAGVPVIAP